MIERSRVRIPVQENFLLQGQLSVLTLISVSVPRVTSVARKRSRPFCQKRKWQVTAKHAYVLRIWLCNKWLGEWLYGVHRTSAGTAAVSCGTSHASAISTPLRRTFKKKKKKKRYKKLVTHVKSLERAVSLLESGEQRCIKAIIIIIITRLKTMCEKIITIMSAFDDTRQT